MVAISRRVSYILPSPSDPPPYLSLPALETQRRGHPRPFLVPKLSNGNSAISGGPELQSKNPFLSPQERTIDLNGSGHPADDNQTQVQGREEQGTNHPRHCLGITSLSLDSSTILSDSTSPGGILYSGGRDGLVCSWELNVKHKKRRNGRYEILPGRGSRTKWERVGDGAEFFDDEDDIEEEEEGNEDGNEDGSGKRRSSSNDRDGSSIDDDEGVGAKREVPYEDRWEVDHEALSNQKPPQTKFRQSAQTHTDWVNALLLCNLNQTVITGSSDRTIRAWSPHAASDEEGLSPTLIGTHRDYVRSLAWAKHPSLLFSGSLDRRLSVWDVQSPHPDSPIFSINMDVIDDYGGVGMEGERGSVYALGTDPAGQILAAGTPERVIRLWDPRIGDRSVGKLIGHSDCVRSVIVSEDGRYLLSGSSDSTVKLWSLAAHRCIHTFNHHTSSVWSLFSNHPNLERFYSGSRDGYLCAVDVEQVGDISDGECVVLSKERTTTGMNGESESKAGDEGIRAIVGMDDQYVWTASGSADIKRWRDVGRRIHRSTQRNGYDGASYDVNGFESLSQPFVQSTPIVPEGIRNKSLLLDGAQDGDLMRVESRESRSIAFAPDPIINGGVEGRSSPSRNNNLIVPSGNAPRRTTMSGEPIAGSIATSILSDMSLPDDPSKPTLNGIPYDSLVCLGIPDSPYGFSFVPGRTTSVHSGNEQGGIIGNNSPRKQSIQFENPQDTTELAKLHFEDREVASEAKPLRSTPDDIIRGRAGLVRCLMLNDRQHVLTVDTDGEVSVWNIVKGVCIGRFSAAEIAVALDLEKGIEAGAAIRKHSNEVLELVKQRVEGEIMVITWCQVDTRIGSLVVHLEEGRVFDAEVYADELGEDLTGLNVKDDTRVNLGKWALANLFKGLIKAEEKDIQQSSPSTQSSAPSLSRSPPPMHLSLPSTTPNRRARALSTISQTPSITISGIATPAANPAQLPEVELPLSRSAPTANSTFLNNLRSGPLSAIPQSPFLATAQSSGGLPSGTASPTPTDNRGDYFSVRKRAESSPNRGTTGSQEPPTPGGTQGTGGIGDSFKGPPGQTPAVHTPGGKMMGKFKGFGKKKEKEKEMSTVQEDEPIKEEDKGPKLSEREQEQLNILETVRGHPFRPPSAIEAPPSDYPPNTALLISEESKDAGAWVVTYRSQVQNSDKDLVEIENNSPLWLLDYLFTSRIRIKEPVKLTFILEPEPNCGLKEMPEGTTRLSASRILRARKVMLFIYDKLELGTARGRAGSIISLHSRITPNPRKQSTALPIPGSNASSGGGGSGQNSARGSIANQGSGNPFGSSFDNELNNQIGSQPEDVIELVCGNIPVDPKITLATLKHYYGSGGDMLLHYRPRKGVMM